MPKRENYDKNMRSVEEFRKRSQALTQSPERRAAQIRYRLNSIEEAVKAGRMEYDDKVNADVKRLLEQAETLEAHNV